MAMAIYPPYNKANEGGLTYPRDASFSSYLDTAERDFVRSLAESINSPSPVGEIPTPRTSTGRKNNIARVQRNGELDVFGAERYFNEKLDDRKGSNTPIPTRKDGGGGGNGNHKHRHRREKRDDISLPRSNISRTSSLKSPTQSLKSEVGGSWNNTQIGLLLPKKGSVGHKIFSGFQCRGSCFDKKSVYITNTHQMVQPSPKYQSINGYPKAKLSNQDHFAFPIIDTASINLEQQSRKSMEVFGLHQLGKQEIERNLEKKLSILSWDAIPNSPNNPLSCTISIARKTSPTVRTENEDEDEDGDEDVDVCSDASSDLFEIENLSGVPGSQASTPYYAPSEGSIEWSVVTASAADNFSAFSDHDDDKISIARGIISKNMRKFQRSSTSGGIFLGCTSHKAVDVVGNYER